MAGRSKNTAARRLECPFRSRKRPWLRRSMPQAGKGPCARELCVLEPARGLQRLFNHLHEGSTTYRRASRRSARSGNYKIFSGGRVS